MNNGNVSWWNTWGQRKENQSELGFIMAVFNLCLKFNLFKWIETTRFQNRKSWLQMLIKIFNFAGHDKIHEGILVTLRILREPSHKIKG